MVKHTRIDYKSQQEDLFPGQKIRENLPPLLFLVGPAQNQFCAETLSFCTWQQQYNNKVPVDIREREKRVQHQQGTRV
jgi:hypothetical protein